MLKTKTEAQVGLVDLYKIAHAVSTVTSVADFGITADGKICISESNRRRNISVYVKSGLYYIPTCDNIEAIVTLDVTHLKKVVGKIYRQIGKDDSLRLIVDGDKVMLKYSEFNDVIELYTLESYSNELSFPELHDMITLHILERRRFIEAITFMSRVVEKVNFEYVNEILTISGKYWIDGYKISIEIPVFLSEGSITDRFTSGRYETKILKRAINPVFESLDIFMSFGFDKLLVLTYKGYYAEYGNNLRIDYHIPSVDK